MGWGVERAPLFLCFKTTLRIINNLEREVDEITSPTKTLNPTNPRKKHNVSIYLLTISHNDNNDLLGSGPLVTITILLVAI
jgi:hypothetical protein